MDTTDIALHLIWALLKSLDTSDTISIQNKEL